MYMSNRVVSYKKQELLTHREHLSSPLVLWWFRIAHLLSFLCCLIMCFYVPRCDVRYDFRIKTMLDSSLPPVVCRRAHVLFVLFSPAKHRVLFYLCYLCLFPHKCSMHIVLYFCFVFLRLVYPILPLSLNCPFFLLSHDLSLDL